jgi:acetyl esterase/lipase
MVTGAMAGCKIERLEGWINGVFVSRPDAGETGVVVLSGSSGRVDIDRARLLAESGAQALALQWFGGPGQSPGICEIPLETFADATDYLIARGCRRIVFVGTSKGAEAALLVATLDPRVDDVIAISPTSVVWGNIGPGKDGIAWPERSSWSWKGKPLDFVPADLAWERIDRDGLVSYRSFFEQCLARDEETLRRARIPVEKAAANLVLVAGGDDALWPSDSFAGALAHRREDSGRPVSLIVDPEAGHRVLLPGETTPRSSLRAHGGTDIADARLGLMAWAAIEAALLKKD